MEEREGGVKEKDKEREREMGLGATERMKKHFGSLLGKPLTLTMQHFDELSANESGIMRNTWAKFSLKYTS